MQTRFLCSRLSLDFICTAKHHPVPEIYDMLRAQTRLDLNSHISFNFMVGNVPLVGLQTVHGRFTDPNCSWACGTAAQSAPKRQRFSKLEFNFKSRKSSWMDITFCQQNSWAWRLLNLHRLRSSVKLCESTLHASCLYQWVEPKITGAIRSPPEGL